jgi:hypothetical protein
MSAYKKPKPPRKPRIRASVHVINPAAPKKKKRGKRALAEEVVINTPVKTPVL